MRPKLKVLANSPGEVLTWATILTSWFDVELFLTPCPFASGGEMRYALEVGRFRAVVSPWSTFALALAGVRPRADVTFERGELLFHLGGDLAYSYMLSRRFGLRPISYIWGNRLFDSRIEMYLVFSDSQRRTLTSRGIHPDKIVKVRDLIWEDMRATLEEITTSGELIASLKSHLSLLLGSRWKEIRFLMPLALRALRTLKRWVGDLKVNVPLSPLISVDEVKAMLRREGLELAEEAWPVLGEDGLELRLLVDRLHRYASIYASELVVTIPGTKTHEVAYLRRPMLVILPLHRPEEIPVGGLVGFLDFLPFGLGKWLKRLLVIRLGGKFRYVALPNILAERQLVPEYRGAFTPDELAKEISRWLESEGDRKAMVDRLSEAYEEFKRGEPVPELLMGLMEESLGR